MAWFPRTSVLGFRFSLLPSICVGPSSLPERVGKRKKKRKKEKIKPTTLKKRGGSNSPFRTSGEHGDRGHFCWCFGCFYRDEYVRQMTFSNPCWFWDRTFVSCRSGVPVSCAQASGFALPPSFLSLPLQKPPKWVNSCISAARCPLLLRGEKKKMNEFLTTLDSVSC